MANRAAMQVYTRQEHPVDWARVQGNLGSILKDLAELREGKAARPYVQEATVALKGALDVYREDEFPLKRAGVLQGLAAALLRKAVLVGVPDGLEPLTRAEAACREGLSVVARERHPVAWAALQHNLGATLLQRASWLGGKEGIAEAEQAASAFRGCVAVYGRETHPSQWAEARRCLALAQELLGDLAPRGVSALHYREALGHARMVLAGPENSLPRPGAHDVVALEQRLASKVAQAAGMGDEPER